MAVEPFALLADAGVVLRAYRGADDVEGIQAVRATVRQAEGDLLLPGPDGEDDLAAPQPSCLVVRGIPARRAGCRAPRYRKPMPSMFDIYQ